MTHASAMRASVSERERKRERAWLLCCSYPLPDTSVITSFENLVLLSGEELTQREWDVSQVGQARREIIYFILVAYRDGPVGQRARVHRLLSRASHRSISLIKIESGLLQRGAAIRSSDSPFTRIQ